jgi:hypothetical protein
MDGIAAAAATWIRTEPATGTGWPERRRLTGLSSGKTSIDDKVAGDMITSVINHRKYLYK